MNHFSLSGFMKTDSLGRLVPDEALLKGVVGLLQGKEIRPQEKWSAFVGF